MKEKSILSISIGCVALILTMIMFTQFKTIENTDIVAIETMRETELRAELAQWKAKYAEIETKLVDTNSRINEYKTQMATENNATELLKQEKEDAEKTLGYTDVYGQGIIITLEDNNYEKIERIDLISLVNELKLAGAEAISINDERIVSSTDIAFVNDRIILVNGNRIAGPYIVKVIGDKKYLESAITIKGGYLDEIKEIEKTISYTVEDEIVIGKYDDKMHLDYVKVKEK